MKTFYITVFFLINSSLSYIDPEGSLGPKLSLSSTPLLTSITVNLYIRWFRCNSHFSSCGVIPSLFRACPAFQRTLIRFHSELVVVSGERRLIMNPKLYQDFRPTGLGHQSFLQMTPEISSTVGSTMYPAHTKYT
jgi:hypothetical protein